MAIKKIVILFAIITIVSFTGGDTYIIRAGIGTDKLIVGKTKVKTVFALLGKNDKFTEGIIDGTDFAIHINRYIYSKLGVTVISHVYEPKGEDLENAIIDHIIFEKHSAAKTVDNIALGISTKENIILKYGQPDKEAAYSDVTYLHFKKKGISFKIDNVTKKLSSIEVYQLSSRPDEGY